MGALRRLHGRPRGRPRGVRARLGAVEPAEPEWRYATLDEARALECNRCGDCCDSSRLPNPTMFAWRLPETLYAECNDDVPLVLPLGGIAGGEWHPVEWADGAARPFRCGALRPQPDGTASCDLHGQPRPGPCSGFPVFAGVDDDGDPRAATLAERGAYLPPTGPFPRCTWYMLLLLPDDNPVLSWRRGDWSLEWAGLTEDQRTEVLGLHERGRAAKPTTILEVTQ